MADTAAPVEVETPTPAVEETKPSVADVTDVPAVADAVTAETDDAVTAASDDDNAADKSADLSTTVGSPAAKEVLADATPVVVVEILERVPATEAEPLTADQAAIIRQVEYYFSNANLARDKFLIAETKKDDGWVPYTVLLTFKRLLALSADVNVIVDALVRSTDDLLQLSKDRLRVRRNPARPMPEQNEKTRQETIARTAYVKGFPLDSEMSKLIEFFDAYESVSNVIMRRYQDKPTKAYKFKGSVFVTFATKDACAAFLALDAVELEGKPLERKWETEYYEAKKAERNSDKKKGKKEEENKIQLPKGAVIHLEGLSAETTRETIKAALQELGGEVAFIDYTKGDKAGHVRLTTENSAAPVFAKFTDAKLALDGIEAVGRVLEGDEEVEFLAKVVENMKTRRNQGNNRFKGGRGGGGNKFGNNRKRRGDRDGGNDEPRAKK